MRSKETLNLAALEELHDTLHLHRFVRFQDFIDVCACGKLDLGCTWDLNQQIDDENFREAVVKRFGPDFYVALVARHEANKKKKHREDDKVRYKLRLKKNLDGNFIVQ